MKWSQETPILPQIPRFCHCCGQLKKKVPNFALVALCVLLCQYKFLLFFSFLDIGHANYLQVCMGKVCEYLVTIQTISRCIKKMSHFNSNRFWFMPFWTPFQTMKSLKHVRFYTKFPRPVNSTKGNIFNKNQLAHAQFL